MDTKEIGRSAMRALFGLPLLLAAASVSAQPTDFFTVAPCRLFDSRDTTALANGVARDIPVSGVCGVPAGTTAVALNFTVVGATSGGNIAVYATGTSPGFGATRITFLTPVTRSNNGVVSLGTNGQLSALATLNAGAGSTVHLVIDLSGYFLAAPVAVDDSFPASFQTPLTVPAPGVLTNDTLNSATILSYGASTGSEQTTIGAATPTSGGGSVTLNADGSFSYTPATGFRGDDTFKYVLQNPVGSSTATVTLPVGKADQTITFTSSAPVGAQVGGATYNVTATATSALSVTFTIDASAASVCTIGGSTVSFIGVGTCVIDADQPGDTNWNAAPQVQQSFAVAKGDQTITFTSTAPVSAKVGGATYNVTATATSALTVALTIDPTATAVCSLSGSTVSFLTVGTCVIDANQAGDVNWNAAPQAQQSFAVGKGDQTITFTSTAPGGATVGGPTYTVTATSNSGLTVTFAIDATATTVCSLSGSTVSFLAAGTCVIDANQAGDANWNAAPQAQQSFPVGKAAQTISFTSTAPSAAKVGGATYLVTATATSGLTVAFTIDATATSVCSISGSTVSFLAVGTCVIDANQAGDANYNAAPQVQQSFAVAKGDQTISFTSTAPAGAKVGGPTYTVTATATSGLAVTFTIDASASTVCSISGSTVSFLTPGTCVIDANQAGNINWNAAPQAQQSFPVAKGDQTISFTSTAPVGAAVGGPTYTVTATATSGLTVTFTIDASATSVCSISGSTVSFIGAGTCVIDANQAGNGNYNPAPQAQQSFAVAKGNQTISFTSTAPVGQTVGGPTYTPTATATSGLAVTFTIDASATSVCSISGGVVSFIGAGSCVIDANQAGNANYNAAPQVQQSFPVIKQNQTISFTSIAPSPATAGGATYTVTATATSGLTVALTIDPSATSVCSISGSTVSFLTSGTCVIDANQAGNATYNAAPQVQQSFAVVKQDQTIAFTSTPPAPAKISPPTYAVTATATSGLTVSFTIDASSSTVCSISGSTVTFATGGTCVIDANQAGNLIYNAAPQVQQSVVINFPPQLVPSPKETFDTVGNTTFQFKATQSVFPGLFVVGNLVDNFTDPDGPSPLSAVAIVNGPTTNGGTVDLATNGEFTFEPKAGDTAASDSFAYQVTDGLYTVTRTVTVNLKSRVWYVKNDAAAGGSGRSFAPFNTLAAAQTASLAGDYIFVYGGDLTTTGQDAGIVLKANQKFYGEAFGLTITNTINGVVNPTLVAATPANRPLIDNPAAGGNAVGITNITGVEVRGFGITANTNAVNVTTTAAGSGSATISDNVITGSGQQGIRVVAGGTGGAAVAILNNSVSATGNAIGVSTTAGATLLNVTSDTVVSAASGIVIDGSGGGTTTITGFANNVVSGNTAGSGIVVTSAKFDAVTGGGYDQVSGGTTVIGASGNGVGAGGLILSTVSGDLAFTDLDVFASGGAAVRVIGTGAVNVGAGTGTRVTVGAGVAIFEAVGGPAVDVTSATIDLQPTSIKSTTSATTGVALNSVVGTFSAGSGSAITGSTGTGFQVGSSNATISYAGAINVSAGKGVDLTTNTGSTISFTGALTLSSGSNTAFNATGGGTVTATDTTSTLVTTTGTALNVANTTIGASGLKFKSISAGTVASGPTNGIVLNTTGSSGGLTVAGTGSAGSGGTIQKCSGDGISLTSTSAVNLSWMNVSSNTLNGIKAASVTGLNLTSLKVQNNTNANNLAGILANNLFGNNAWTGLEVSGSTEDNIQVKNDSGVLNSLVISGTGGTGSSCFIHDNSAASGNTAISILATVTAEMDGIDIHDCLFKGNRTDTIHVDQADTSKIGDASDGIPAGARIANNYILSGLPGNQGNIGIDVSGVNGQIAYDIDSNHIGTPDGTTPAPLLNHGINVFIGSPAGTGSMRGLVRNNTVYLAGAGVAGFGIRMFPFNGTYYARVENNLVKNVGQDYGLFVGAGENSGAGGAVQVGVFNNNVSVLSGALDAIRVQSRNTSSSCARISGNTTSAGGLGGGTCGANFCGLFVRQANTSTFSLEGGTGALAGNNPGAATIASGGTITTVAANFCSLIP